MEIVNRLNQNPFIGFLLRALSFYLIWQIIYDLILHPDGRLDEFLSLSVIYISKIVLTFLGWTVHTYERIIWIEGTQGLEIVNGCNALKLMVLYSGFIICFGNEFKEKLGFLVIGITMIYLLNAIRIILFNLAILYFKQYWDIFHEFSPFLFFYPFILWLWYKWTLVGVKNHDIRSFYESSLS